MECRLFFLPKSAQKVLFLVYGLVTSSNVEFTKIFLLLSRYKNEYFLILIQPNPLLDLFSVIMNEANFCNP